MKLGKLVFTSKKGSSLVSVIIVIAVMLILSSGLISITQKNSRFGKRVISKSDDYYDLERIAEETLKGIDERIEISENKSIEYMKEKNYNLETAGYDTVDQGKQAYFNKRYKDVSGNKGFDKFLDEAFGRVYYINLQQNFADGKHEKNKIKINKNKEISVDFHAEFNKPYAAINGGTGWDEFKAEEGDTLFKITLEDNNGKKLKVVAKSKVPVYDTTRNLKITEASKANPIWANAITARGGIKFLDSKTNIYGDLFSSDNKVNINNAVIRGNKEGILVEDSDVNIYGNVYSRGDFHISSGEKKSVVAVYKDSESKSIDVNRRCKNFILSNESYYDEEILKGITTPVDLSDIAMYTEGEKRNADTRTFPFIFKDNSGGNVYCNDLSVENAAVGGSEILIDGNVCTNGSIINDSLYGKTKIELKGTYLGLTSVDRDDVYNQNRGSCIVNNIYNTTDKLENMNKIVLTDKLIVPGVNFMDDKGRNKYKTGESITSNFWDSSKMLAAYTAEKGEKGENVSLNFRNIKTKNGKNSCEITNVDKLVVDLNAEGRYNRILQNVYKKDNPSEVENFITNIYIPDKYTEKSITGYCEGSAIVVKDKLHRLYGHSYREIINGENIDMDYTIDNCDDNKTTYNNLEGILKRIFQSKTINFGTKSMSFDNSVDVSMLAKGDEGQTGIKFLDHGGQVTVSGNEEKIIYSDGDLTITGEGTLKGTIICRGNVTIKGKVDVIYDEEVIKRTIKTYPAARNFFKPGETGKYCITKESIEVDQRSRDKKAPATYKIVQWEEETK